MSALKRLLFLAGNLGKQQYITLDVIVIDFKGYVILCIGIPIAVMLCIFLDILAISSPIFQRVYYPSCRFDVYAIIALL